MVRYGNGCDVGDGVDVLDSALQITKINDFKMREWTDFIAKGQSTVN